MVPTLGDTVLLYAIGKRWAVHSEMGKELLKDDDRRGEVCKWKWKMGHGY